jgi:hypothetical protein
MVAPPAPPPLPRLRQVALAAVDLEATLDALRAFLDAPVVFRDPGVAEFGLVNGLVAVGGDLVEVVAPTRDDAPARRFLDRRGGDAGYMAIFQVDDLDAAVARCAATGVRVVWQLDLAPGRLTCAIRGRHLHPADTGGCLVSLDRAEPVGSWRWAGEAWPPNRGLPAPATGRADGIAGITVAAADVETTLARWAAILGVAATNPLVVGDTTVAVEPGMPGTDRIVALRLRAADPADTGDSAVIAGTTVILV